MVDAGRIVGISKPHTRRQHHAAESGRHGVSRPARADDRCVRRTMTRPIRIRRLRVAVLRWSSWPSPQPSVTARRRRRPRRCVAVDVAAEYCAGAAEACPGRCGRQTARPPSRSGSRRSRRPNQHPAPIASVAKVMTAYLVLRDDPLRLGQDGPMITSTDADVAILTAADSRSRSCRSPPGGYRPNGRRCRRCSARRWRTVLPAGSGADGDAGPGRSVC